MTGDLEMSQMAPFGQEHDADDNVVMMVFTEFGRRIRDNGSGTDHGSGGGAFLIGEPINGGLYSEYPMLEQGRTSFEAQTGSRKFQASTVPA